MLYKVTENNIKHNFREVPTHYVVAGFLAK